MGAEGRAVCRYRPRLEKERQERRAEREIVFGPRMVNGETLCGLFVCLLSSLFGKHNQCQVAVVICLCSLLV